MARLKKITPEEATGELKETYDAVKKDAGMVPNLFQGFANNPMVLKMYLAMDEMLEDGVLDEKELEVVRLTASEHNGCDYCLAAHTAVGKMKGLSEDETKAIRKGTTDNPKYSALHDFTKKVLETKGFIKEADIEDFRSAGFEDEHIGEVTAIIAQKTLSNYFNHINDTEVDFPEAPSI